MKDAEVETMLAPAAEALARCFPGRAVCVMVWPTDHRKPMKWSTNGRRGIVIKGMRAIVQNEAADVETPVATEKSPT